MRQILGCQVKNYITLGKELRMWSFWFKIFDFISWKNCKKFLSIGPVALKIFDPKYLKVAQKGLFGRPAFKKQKH